MDFEAIIDSLKGVFSEPLFYPRVVVGWILWWLLARFIAWIMFRNGGEPENSARVGLVLGIPMAVIVTAVGSWYIWQNMPLVLALGITTLVVPLVFAIMLIRAEATVES